MGSSSKTTNSSQSQNETGSTTSTPTVAPWLSAAQANLGNFANNGLSTFQDYVPESNSALQSTAFGNASNLGSAGSDALNSAVSSAQGLTNQTAPTYSATTFSAPGTPSSTPFGSYDATGTGYTAAQTGNTGYSSTNAGATGYGAATAGSQGYDPTSSSAAQLSSLISSGGLNTYFSPYLSDVVGTTDAAMDRQNAQQQAALKAQAGLTGGFGGSGYGISSAELSADQGLNEAQTNASLLNSGYNTALSAAQQDVANQQETALANQSAANAAGAFGASAANTAGLTNAAAQNAASEFGAAAQNASSLQNAQNTTNASQFGAQAYNNMALSNQAAENTASEFGAAAQNAAGLQNAQLATSANNASAEAQNAMASLGYSGQLSADQANASAQNAASQSNQSSQLQTLAQKLQAALDLGGLGSQQYANANSTVGTQAALGQTQYGQDVAQQDAPFTVAQLVANILSGEPTNAYTATQTNGTSSGASQGTSTTTSSPSFLEDLMGVANLGSSLSGSFGSVAGGLKSLGMV